MQSLFDIAKKAADLTPGLILNMILKNPDLQKKILDLNRVGQLYDKGIDSTGTKLSVIGGSYSGVTMEIAEEKGRPKFAQDHINLHDTGDFYASFTLLLDDESFFIQADPIKDDTNLFTEWGEDIIGLTEESKEILRSFVITEMRQVLLEYLLA